jgi:signal peptidase II
VVDFIGYGNLFIGNIADIAIFAGAIMLAVLTVMGVHLRRPDPEETEKSEETEQIPPPLG